jgi:phosphoserine phosphatase
MVDMGHEIVEERIIPRVYEDIMDVIEEHKERGDLTYLVTATPIELADTVAKELGMTGAIGTESEIDDAGHYTGRLVGDVIHGPAKAKAVAEVAAAQGIDLLDCSAYSDSINDLPLLESVGDAHAVNPERELLRVARTRGWHVHELRSKRRALLIGVPAGVGGAGLVAGGIALGMWLERRRYWRLTRRAAALRRRIARRLRR